MLQALKNVTEKQSKFFINELHCFALNLAFPSCRNKHLNAVLELFASIKSVCCLRRNLAERIAGTFSLSLFACMNIQRKKVPAAIVFGATRGNYRTSMKKTVARLQGLSVLYAKTKPSRQGV